MKHIMTKTAALLSGILMFLAQMNTFPYRAGAMLDFFGYVIYLAVFAAPCWCFFSFVAKENKQ